MQHIELARNVAVADGAEAYARLCRLEEYPRLTDAVRRVTVHRGADGRSASDWEVSFRDGLLCWSEEDYYDDTARVLRFCQTRGDFQEFAGDWAVVDEGPVCSVRFRATFDLGMVSLAELVEPLAVQVLRENVDNILAGLFGR